MARRHKNQAELRRLEPGKASYWKILMEFIKLFFDTSSIHGFPHISQKGRHIVERIIWIVIVTVAIYCVGVLSNLTWNRYKENPTVISMERDRFSWNTTFPPATICTDKKININLLDEYVDRNDSIKNKTLFKQFVVSLAEATYLNLETVVDYEEIPGEEFTRLISQFTFPFKSVITTSVGNEKDLVIDQVFTEMGICYTFNSHLAQYYSVGYWNNGTWNLLPKRDLFLINPLEADTMIFVTNLTSGYKIYFHGPYETIDISSKNAHVDLSKHLVVHLTALTIFASDSLKGLTPKQRHCRFYYEHNLPHFPVYSYVLCRMECRLELSKKFCGCLPHFYRKLDGEKVCDVKGLHCLAKHKEKLILLKKQCSCMSNCDETMYAIEHFYEADAWVGSFLNWGMKEYPKMRLKRDLIFGFSDVLVYIGGMAGLFLGCSVLSFIEIVYFFTLRLFWFVIKYRNETKEKLAM